MEILECTLRDGSYAINFGFTASDTAAISKALEKAGFNYIEIGHGVGLGASKKGFGEAAETDEGYLRAAADAVTRAKYGMFCIPGIASLDDVELCKDYKTGFLRVGTNVNDVLEATPFVERAKKYGMFVAVNFMKSYASDPQDFALKAREAEKMGVDCVYVVDSCGGMLPSDIDAYFKAVRDISSVPLAFHGHHNLGLGVANSLRAIENGAVMVDTSLQGFGRSSGNAPTEMLVCALDRAGIATGIDALDVMDVSERHIRPLMRRVGHSSIDMVCGWAQFHSSYMGLIRTYSSRYQVDPRLLIIEICKVDKVHLTAEMVEAVAKKMQQHDSVTTARYEFDRYFGNEESR